MSTNTLQELQEFTDSATQNMISANQLYKQYGQPLNIPFNNWIEQQMLKAKASNWYQEGMTIAEIVRKNLEDSINNEVNVIKDIEKETKPFKILGMNGYAVLTVSALAIIGTVVYIKSKASNK